MDIAEGSIPQTPPSIINALKKKGAVLNVFKQTESQATSEFHLDVRSRLFLQQIVCDAATSRTGREDEDRVLVKERLLTLIETFQDQILSGKDQQGRTVLHLIAISFSIIWVLYGGRFITDDDGPFYLRDLADTIVKKLIAIGCSVNETDIYGYTPLHYAEKHLKKLLNEDGNNAIDEIPQQWYFFSSPSYDVTKEVMNRIDETRFLLLMNNKQV